MGTDFREKLLQRLGEEGKLQQRELLNIILSNAFGGRDYSAVAEALTNRFPGLRSMFEAGYEELVSVNGVTPNIALYLKSLGMIGDGCDSEAVEIKSTEDCIEYASKRLRLKDVEVAELYLIDKSCKVIKTVSYTSRLATKVEISVKKLTADISGSGAYAMYFVHNHVNCSPKPSQADDDLTAKIKFACQVCNIKLRDHCIVTSNGESFSYTLTGRMDVVTAKY